MHDSEVTPVVAVPDLLDYGKAKIRIDGLIGSWKSLQDRAKEYRDDRYIELDVEEMRRTGEILPSETFTPQRVIHANIVREKADAMAFLNGSSRLAYFRCVDDPTLDTRELESQFTKGLTYEGWYLTFDRHFDGASLHGWDCIEVVYDETKPLHVGFVHLGVDKVFFNRGISDIEDAPLIVIENEVTVMALEEFVTDNGFDANEVNKILAKNQDRRKDDQILKIYKIYFKLNKCVYVAWYTQTGDVSTWLKAPEKLRVGLIKPAPSPDQILSIGQAATEPSAVNLAKDSQSSVSGLTTEDANDPSSITAIPSPDPIENTFEEEVYSYPIFLYIAFEDEQHAITDKKGRGFFDSPQQEAVTAVTTGYVNCVLQASNVFAAPKDHNEETNKQLEEIDLENGVILPVPMTFHNMPYPDPSVLAGLQYLGSVNSQQNGKMAVAVSNRKDSRKTAKELDLASNEEQKITSTSLANYSDFLRKIFAFTWKIVQAQAMAERIIFLPKIIQGEVPVAPGIPGIPKKIIKNDFETIGLKFDIRAAGDIDVLQKQQQLQDFQQDWPVLQNTPLAMVFLEDYLRLRYPQQADKYIAVLKAGNPGKQIVQSLLTTLQGALQPEELQALKPIEQQQLQQVVQSAQQYLASPV